MARKRSLWTLQLLLMSVFVGLNISPSATGQRFYPDDPLERETDDQDASKVRTADPSHTLSGWQAIRGVGDRSSRRAMNVNTLDEVPDSNWFTNRIGRRPLTNAEIAQGPDTLSEPPSGPWVVVAGKSDGVTPGLRLKDAAGRLFFAKFDPPGYPEMASGAEVVATKLLFALGYWVPENYVALLRRDELTIASGATFKGPDGKKRPMTTSDIDHLLKDAARNADGTYRMLASLSVEGQPVGPFEYFGTRIDDPNDIVPHEHRRELRALRVFAAWINHVDTKGQNSLDTLVNVGAQKVVRHYLLDFGSSLGSAGTEPKNWRDGFEYAFERRTALLALLTLGTRAPAWLRIEYPHLPSVGRIESKHFDPEQWKPTLPNPAFQNARADDTMWAAQRVMAFSDEAIRAVVARARFSDPNATRYLSEVLIDRRNKIGRTWLTDVNPITDPTIDAQGHLAFHNAAADAAVTMDRPQYHIRWSLFDNTTRLATPLSPWISVQDTQCPLPSRIPATALFLKVEIATVHPRHPLWAEPVHLYFRRHAERSWELIAFERLAQNAEPVQTSAVNSDHSRR